MESAQHKRGWRPPELVELERALKNPQRSDGSFGIKLPPGLDEVIGREQAEEEAGLPASVGNNDGPMHDSDYFFGDE